MEQEPRGRRESERKQEPAGTTATETRHHGFGKGGGGLGVPVEVQRRSSSSPDYADAGKEGTSMQVPTRTLAASASRTGPALIGPVCSGAAAG